MPLQATILDYVNSLMEDVRHSCNNVQFAYAILRVPSDVSSKWQDILQYNNKFMTQTLQDE